MKNKVKNRLGQLSHNLAFRYLGLTSILLVSSQIILGTIQAGWDYTQKITNLEQKVEEVGNFLSAITQESGLEFEDPAFTRLLRQTSVDSNLVYSIVIDNKGRVLSSFLNPNYFRITFREQDYKELDIVKIANLVRDKGRVRELRRPIISTQQYIGEIRLGYTVDPNKREVLYAIELIIFKALLVSTLLGIILFIIFYREIHSPLQSLAQWMYQTSQQYLEQPLPQQDYDPIKQLKVNLQTIVEQLSQEKKLAQGNQSESHGVQGQAESLARSRFLAMVSHELRTPLNAVTGMTSLLFDTKLNSQQREFVSIIRNSSENLLTMINNILDFAKIEARKLELEEQPFELGLCIEEALRLFVPQASEKKLELAYLIEPQTPTAIVGDVTRLRQILVNLLSNAVKFTESGEVVVYVNATSQGTTENLNTSSQPYEIRFAVKDTGIGIATNRMDRLFKSFSQVDASTSRKYGGTGLGLAISKRLTEMMGGKMWVHSVDGKGSTFYFTLLAKAAASSSPANSHTAEEILGGKRLLIIDDNVTNQKILTLQAQSWGMFTCAVDSGNRALEWLERGVRFDVAILDMNMPQMNGLTLAREIRKRPNYQDLPLVMLSSLGKPELSKQVESLKFAAILTKPIQQAQLYGILVRILTERPIKVTQSVSNHVELLSLAESHPLRILVAEDVTVNQEVIRLQLEKLGYIADVVSNGLEVLQALNRQPYDVILMDVRMPEMDGLTTAHRIQQDYPRLLRPKIIAMTADAMQGDREKCLEMGMDDYLAKPVRLEDLRRALSQAGQHRATDGDGQATDPGSPSRVLPYKARSSSSSGASVGETHQFRQQTGSKANRSQPLANITPLVPTHDSNFSERPPVLERKILDSLQVMAGQRAPQMLSELIANYLEDAVVRLEAIAMAIQKNEPDMLRQAVHALRSASLQLGAVQLATLCQEIETMARSRNLLGVGEKFIGLETEYNQVCNALNQELENINSTSTR